MAANFLVLCPIDFSEHSRSALRVGQLIAEYRRGRVKAIAITDPLLVQAAAFAGGPEAFARETEHDLRSFVAETFQTAGTMPDVDIEVRSGRPAPEVLAASRESDADLIVMSTRGLSGFRKAFFGATTERVLRETAVPVLVTPAHDSGPVSFEDLRSRVRRVVAPVDLSEATPGQVSTAAAVAEVLGVPLVVAHVIEPFPLPAAWRSRLRSVDNERRSRADAALEDLAAKIQSSQRYETVRLYGDPAEEIAKLARDRDAGLIVIGLHSSPLFGPRMGSVTYRVLCLVSIPVLALPPRGAGTSGPRRHEPGIGDGTPAPPSTP
jgi:nucleotide-binding universal stress UspA family protein